MGTGARGQSDGSDRSDGSGEGEEAAGRRRGTQAAGPVAGRTCPEGSRLLVAERRLTGESEVLYTDIRESKHCFAGWTMPASISLSASLEDYLETIFVLVEEGHVARVKDIAARMNVQMPSVTGALRTLSSKELVNYDPYSYITLTKRGESVAREVVRRHEVLSDFLAGFLGLDRETSERNACHMEHAIEPVVLDLLVDFVEFAEQCPRAGTNWVRGKAYGCRQGEHVRNCEDCIERCLADVRAAQRGDSRAAGHAPLAELGPGERAFVVRIEADEHLAARLRQSELRPGVLVEVEGVDAGGLVSLKVRGYRLSLSPTEAGAIVVDTSLARKGNPPR